MGNLKKSVKKIMQKSYLYTGIVFAIMSFLFLSVPVSVFPDSLTYYNYLKIFDGLAPISSWAILRGPSLPIVIFFAVSIFGSAMIGLLMCMYAFFAGLLMLIYRTLLKIMYELKTSKRMRAFAILSFLFLIVFNPILFGYGHALLTEFVALFLSFAACVMAWRWMGVDFVSSKLKYATYSIGFALIFVFMWFLKQPYVTVAFFPLVIAASLSICAHFSLRNVIQRTTTVIIAAACLPLAISGWRMFLGANGVGNGSVNNVDGYYLNTSIIDGISNVRQVLNDQVDLAQVDTDRLLTESEKIKIKEIKTDQQSGGRRRVLMLNILSWSGAIVDKMPVFLETGVLKTDVAIKVWVEVAVRHPLILIDSYIANYLAIIDFYNYKADYVAETLYPIRQLSLHGHENHSIGLLYAYYPANMSVETRNNITYPGLRFVKNENIGGVKALVLKVYGILHCGIYLVFFLLLPFTLAYSVIRYRRLARAGHKGDAIMRTYELIIIILGFTFLHVLFHDVMGAIIDRYAYIAFPGVALSYILLIITNDKAAAILDKVRLKNRTKKKEQSLLFKI